MKQTKVIFLSLLTGFLNGLFGAGGGTVLVLLMERVLKWTAHKSHATAIAVILPLTVISIILYGSFGFLDVRLAIFVSLGGVVGGFLGAKLLKKVPSYWLHKIFGLLMLVAAGRMLFT